MEKTQIPQTRIESWIERLQSGHLKTIADRIIRYLHDCNCERTYNEISKDLDIKHPSLTQPLKQLSEDGILLRDHVNTCPISGHGCIAYRLSERIAQASRFTDN